MKMRQGVRNSGPVPKKWLHCPPNGNHLIASKFMPLKTPLSKNFDNKLAPEHRYPPQKLFDLADRNNVKIGLWIDLTNTDRYYFKGDIEREGCNYVKINLTGHGQVPPWRKTRLFISLVHQHITKYPYDCIAVHCTHGFNRTGFMIVSFLVEKRGFNVKAAVEAFAHARPPGIYREEYVRELFQRYGNIEDTPPAPLLPKWCIEEDRTRRKRKYDLE